MAPLQDIPRNGIPMFRLLQTQNINYEGDIYI